MCVKPGSLKVEQTQLNYNPMRLLRMRITYKNKHVRMSNETDSSVKNFDAKEIN